MTHVVLIENSSSTLHAVAKHLCDPDCPYLPAVYHPCNQSDVANSNPQRLVALEVAVRDITLIVTPGDGLVRESLTVEMCSGCKVELFNVMQRLTSSKVYFVNGLPMSTISSVR